jgi:hypothetical protein
LQYIGFWLTPYVPTMYQEYTFWTVVKVPVNGRFPAGELARRDPSFWSRARLSGGAEAHLHTRTLQAPPGAVLGAVNRRQARYKLGAGDRAGAGTHTRGPLAGWATLAAKFRGFETR